MSAPAETGHGEPFAALGDPVRRRILQELSGGERTAGVIVAAVQARTPISQPAVSQHLKVLRAARLVSVRVEGTRRVYTLDLTGIDAARAWLDDLADPAGPSAAFGQPLEALATEIARGRRHRDGGAGAHQPPGQAGHRDARPA